MSIDTFMYFAYGSNMLFARLRERCPSAEPVDMVELSGYELRWHKLSRKDGSGKCDIVRNSNNVIYGVLYRIAGADKRRLDLAEGLGYGYKEIGVQVFSGGSNITAGAYQATETDESVQPYSWYQALVVSGAKEHGLPQDYIEKLQLVTSMEDTDRVRHHEEMLRIQETFQ